MTQETYTINIKYNGISVEGTATFQDGEVAKSTLKNTPVPGFVTWRGRKLIFVPSRAGVKGIIEKIE